MKAATAPSPEIGYTRCIHADYESAARQLLRVEKEPDQRSWFSTSCAALTDQVSMFT
jgi:hypothetical protein